MLATALKTAEVGRACATHGDAGYTPLNPALTMLLAMLQLYRCSTPASTTLPFAYAGAEDESNR